MTVRELRQKYLEFFQSKGHIIHPSGSLVPYDVTGKLDESLLFTGAGMVQFKPYFRGLAQPPNKRLVTSQKCVRTGDIETVGDSSHLTFFEMMGNFSLGEYFKKEAIALSWEFITSAKWLSLDPRRVAFTVFEEDDEAYELWATQIGAANLQAEDRIFRLGEETNFWPAGSFSKGPPGPCGPNTEMFYWTSKEEPSPNAPYCAEDFVRDEAQGKWLEFWNDVFIQYEWQGRLRNPQRPGDGYDKTGMPSLPFESVDTGMGLERTVTVLGGFKSIYDIDVFQPIIAKISSLANRMYESNPSEESRDQATRIIADHIRTAVFCIADGILPANTGRGYVLRRLIRRAVLKGQRVLGIEQPFFHEVFEGVLESMGDHYRELHERGDVIVETLKSEETLFRRTLAEGYRTFLDYLHTRREAKGLGAFPGDLAFKLYDTYGFPLEVTQELAAEAGLEVDLESYGQAMREAQERSRGASGMDAVYGEHDEALVIVASKAAVPQTRFIGYDHTEAKARVAQVSPRFDADRKTTGTFQISLDQTPFYAESGGQVGDTGTISSKDWTLRVLNTWREFGQIWHDVEPSNGSASLDFKGLSQEAIVAKLEEGLFFKDVEARVDIDRRRRITRNHTATHLLHAALRTVLGNHVTQAGSLVAPDHLRFDFTHGRAMSPEEVAIVERLVNEHALLNEAVQTHADISIDEAKQRGAMALFGEKYGDRVRMVQIGNFSLELCGGCHVRSTGEIGLFKILSESSAASGVRRIEAVTGEDAYDWVLSLSKTVGEAARILKSSPKELVHAAERAVEQQRELNKRLERLRTQNAGDEAAKTEMVGQIELAIERLPEGDSKEATLIVDRLAEGRAKRVSLVSLLSDGKALFVCKAGAEAVALGAHAGNLVRELAKIAGGGGGGRADFATAGGKNVGKMEEALASASRILGQQMNGTGQ